jgi:uncharacterized protein YigA (DUF484 family)
MNEVTLTANQVEDYLLQHPEFFQEHLSLLEKITVPHPSGEAVSLISRQLEVYRAKHRELENQLMELIETARENDSSFLRMHRLTIAMLEASSIKELLDNLDKILTEYFITDFVAVRIFKNLNHSTIENIFISPESEDIKPFTRELSNKQPKFGLPTLEQANVLFGDKAMEVKSCAIIPLSFFDSMGILAIGSVDQGRFHYTMGSLFLMQMGELVAARLTTLLRLEVA